jgi:hypothetical protein
VYWLHQERRIRQRQRDVVGLFQPLADDHAGRPRGLDLVAPAVARILIHCDIVMTDGQFPELRTAGSTPGAFPAAPGRLRWVAAPLAVVAMATAALAGCAPAGHRTQAGAQVTPPSIPSSPPRAPAIANTTTIHMPLDNFFLTDQELAVIDAAVQIRTASCMRSRGFAAAATPVAAGQPAAQGLTEPYGINDPEQAARYGYASPAAVNGIRGGHKSPRRVPRRTSAWWIAMIGATPPGPRATPPDHAAARDPEGCFPQATTQIMQYQHAAHDGVDIGLPGQLAQLAVDDTAADSRVRRAEARWSGCMSAAGFRYSTPDAAESARWPALPDRAEIATAVTDVACKQRTNLPGIWLATQAGYERELIAANGSRLHAVKKFHAAAAHRAELVVAARQ